MFVKKVLFSVLASALCVSAASAASLKVGSANMPPFLDPGRDHSNVGQQFYYNTFDTLIDKDYNKSNPEFVPGLAVSWELVEPKVMELKLRKGVKFHNGDEMTADDVVFSYDRLFNASFTPYVVRSKDRMNNFDKVEKVDDYTVRVTVKQEEPLWETLLNMQQLMIIPAAYTKALSGDPNVAEDSDYEAFALAPVGTGPYKITEFIPGERLVWEKFDGFWGEKAPLDKVSMSKIAEMSSRLTALKNNEVDLITNVSPDQLDVIEADSKLKVASAVTPLFHLVIYNTQNPLMDDPKLRRALNMAINRDLLNEALWFGKAIVPPTHTFSQFGDLYMPELKTFEYNLDEAKKLLAESDYKGEEIRFDTSATYYTNGFLAAQAIQEMWAAIGVKTKINVDDKWSGSDPTMNARNWSNPLYFADPFGSFGVMWAPGGPAESEGRFKPTAEYAKVWQEFRFSKDLEQRKAAYAKLMDFIKNDPPFLVLYQPFESWGMNKKVDWAPKPGHIPYVLDFRAGSIKVAE